MSALAVTDARGSASALPPDTRLTCPTCGDQRNLDDFFLWANQANAALLFARGMVAARRGDSVGAAGAASRLRRQAATLDSDGFAASVESAALQIDALANNDVSAATKAVALELGAGPPPYGPPVIPPAAETLALLLLAESNVEAAMRALRVLRSQELELGNQGRASSVVLRMEALLAVGSVEEACALFAARAVPMFSEADAGAYWATRSAVAGRKAGCADEEMDLEVAPHGK